MLSESELRKKALVQVKWVKHWWTPIVSPPDVPPNLNNIRFAITVGWVVHRDRNYLKVSEHIDSPGQFSQGWTIPWAAVVDICELTRSPYAKPGP